MFRSVDTVAGAAAAMLPEKIKAAPAASSLVVIMDGFLVSCIALCEGNQADARPFRSLRKIDFAPGHPPAAGFD
jgi:hypothetical protein